MEDTHCLKATSEGVRTADTSCQTSDDVTPGGVTSGLSWRGRDQGKFSRQAQGRHEEPAPSPCPERGPRRPLSGASCVQGTACSRSRHPLRSSVQGWALPAQQLGRLRGRPRPSSLWARRLAQPATLPRPRSPALSEAGVRGCGPWTRDPSALLTDSETRSPQA